MLAADISSGVSLKVFFPQEWGFTVWYLTSLTYWSRMDLQSGGIEMSITLFRRWLQSTAWAFGTQVKNMFLYCLTFFCLV